MYIRRDTTCTRTFSEVLAVPRFKQEVTVVGEVQHPTSHIFNRRSSIQDYIHESGGLTQKADDDRIYVVKANGRVFLPKKNRWFRKSPKVEAGDTVVVPLDPDRVRPITVWTDVTQVFYQMALGAAAIASF